MRTIRRLILTSLAAVAFIGMTAATSHADSRRSSYGDATGGTLSSDSGNMENPASSGDRYLGEPGNYNEQDVPDQPAEHLGVGAGGQIEQTAPLGTSSYQGSSTIQSGQYSGQGAGGFQGQSPCCNQSPCYHGSTVSGGTVGSGTGGSTGYDQNYQGSSYYQQGQQSNFQSGQATGGYQGQSVNTPCCQGSSNWSGGTVGSGAGGSTGYQQQQNFQSGQGTYQQNFNQNPCCTGSSSMGSGAGGSTGYQQGYQQGTQSYQQPMNQQGTGYQQNYQGGTGFQGQGAGGSQMQNFNNPCCNPCQNQSSMGTGGMTGTTDMRSSNMQSGTTSNQQQWHQHDMHHSGTMSSGTGTGGPCDYTYGSGAGGSMGRDFYGTGFHSWVEHW